MDFFLGFVGVIIIGFWEIKKGTIAVPFFIFL